MGGGPPGLFFCASASSAPRLTHAAAQDTHALRQPGKLPLYAPAGHRAIVSFGPSDRRRRVSPRPPSPQTQEGNKHVRREVRPREAKDRPARRGEGLCRPSPPRLPVSILDWAPEPRASPPLLTPTVGGSRAGAAANRSACCDARVTSNDGKPAAALARPRAARLAFDGAEDSWAGIGSILEGTGTGMGRRSPRGCRHARWIRPSPPPPRRARAPRHPPRTGSGPATAASAHRWHWSGPVRPRRRALAGRGA